MMKTLKNKLVPSNGFTLVELLVVIAIIAILSVTAYVALGGQTSKARDARRLQDLSAIQNALEIYAINNGGQYPTTLGGLTQKEMPNVPQDPSGKSEYAYNTTATLKYYQLGATLEGEGEDYEAYVLGNGGTQDLLTPFEVKAGDCVDPFVTNGSKTCLPVQIW